MSQASPPHDVSPADDSEPSERQPLLDQQPSLSHTRQRRPRKPWYRPRPLWLGPFMVIATLCRGMTLAPRTEVLTLIACHELRSEAFPYPHHSRHRHHARIDALADARPPVFAHSPFEDPLTFLSYPAHENGNPIDDPDDTAKQYQQCLRDAAVQSRAAKLQTIFTTTVGLLNALTTVWWGSFGDRHGRTTVLAISVFGAFFTDSMFFLVSSSPNYLNGHAFRAIILAAIVEGLGGGHPTMLGVTNAYISDCTSDGTRAQIFARFSGASFIGLAVGPQIAALILRLSGHLVSDVFATSALCAFINLLLALFIFPESLSKEQRQENINKAKDGSRASGVLATFTRPFRVFKPMPRLNGRRGSNWNLTFLVLGMFGYVLSMGLFQIKYLYAEHAFGWDAESLSYYISLMGFVRALGLLVILPTLIQHFKPSSALPARKGQKTAVTPARVFAEIKFDLLVAKLSLLIDLCSHSLVVLFPASSAPLFVGATLGTSLGAGLTSALQSAALSSVHLRDETLARDAVGAEGAAPEATQKGELFGAFSMVHATGMLIIGPLVFGTLYSATVSFFPKAIFVLAACLIVVAMAMLLCIRLERGEYIVIGASTSSAEGSPRRTRGRSRASKPIGEEVSTVLEEVESVIAV